MKIINNTFTSFVFLVISGCISTTDYDIISTADPFSNIEGEPFIYVYVPDDAHQNLTELSWSLIRELKTQGYNVTKEREKASLFALILLSEKNEERSIAIPIHNTSNTSGNIGDSHLSLTSTTFAGFQTYDWTKNFTTLTVALYDNFKDSIGLKPIWIGSTTDETEDILKYREGNIRSIVACIGKTYTGEVGISDKDGSILSGPK